MFSIEWLCYFVQYLIMIPAAISCYLPAKNHMKFSMLKTVILCCAVIVPVSFIVAYIAVISDINVNIVMFPAVIVFFFLYRLTVNLDIPRALAIYVGVCTIETFPGQFALIIDTYLNEEAVYGLSLKASFIQLGLSFFLLLCFIYPARRIFSKAVDELDIPKVWYSTLTFSFIIFILNMLAFPDSYDIVRDSKLAFLFPMMEICELALLIAFYVLFYRLAITISEHEKLEKRSQLLEMQEHRFRELQEYMQNTQRLRHDFRHSVHLLMILAEKGDLESICAHLLEYEQRFSENISVNYCTNPALNALFSYYHEIADLNGVKTDWKIELPEPLTVSELDMSALFGNLMENAITACSQLPEEERYFGLTSEVRQKNCLYIVSTNRFNGKVRKGSDGYRSTKRSGKGIGLASIAAVAEKYNGVAKVSNSENEFYVDVILKI